MIKYIEVSAIINNHKNQKYYKSNVSIEESNIN